jgi:hypothetical protein
LELHVLLQCKDVETIPIDTYQAAMDVIRTHFLG